MDGSAKEAGEARAAARPGLEPPRPAVTNPMLMGTWERSEARAMLLSFVKRLGTACEGRAVGGSRAEEAGEGVRAAAEEMRALLASVRETPLEQQPQRFGNRAYRVWHARMSERAVALHARLGLDEAATAAVLPYFTGAFGNATRLDFGTGHELSFVAWLQGLCVLRVLAPGDLEAAVLDAYAAYLDAVREVIIYFQLEPAGSRGSQGLDDYMLLPFFFGACQVVRPDGSTPEPPAAGDDAAAADATRDMLANLTPAEAITAPGMERFGGANLYAGAVRFACQCKTGAPLAEHSPTLYSLRDVEWVKVRRGMLRMWTAEVIGSFPCVQHLPLGGLLPFTPVQRGGGAGAGAAGMPPPRGGAGGARSGPRRGLQL